MIEQFSKKSPVHINVQNNKHAKVGFQLVMFSMETN